MNKIDELMNIADQWKNETEGTHNRARLQAEIEILLMHSRKLQGALAAIKHNGLTLVKTESSYVLLNLGEIFANQTILPKNGELKDVHLTQVTDELQQIIAQSYQVIAVLANDCGRFDTPSVSKALDNTSQMKLIHRDVLPFPSSSELCMCKQRLLSDCPGEWEPGCDLGNNEKHAVKGENPFTK
jgi:hypothetical protein